MAQKLSSTLGMQITSLDHLPPDANWGWGLLLLSQSFCQAMVPQRVQGVKLQTAPPIALEDLDTMMSLAVTPRTLLWMDMGPIQYRQEVPPRELH